MEEGPILTIPPVCSLGFNLIPLTLSFFPSLYLLTYLFMAALGLCCCAQAFSSCGERWLLFVAVRGLLIAVASLCCGARALGTRASVVVAHGLSGSAACGIFPDQGLNPCPLHWQASSLLLTYTLPPSPGTKLSISFLAFHLISPIFWYCFFFNIYLFIWLHQVLVVACSIF